MSREAHVRFYERRGCNSPGDSPDTLPCSEAWCSLGRCASRQAVFAYDRHARGGGGRERCFGGKIAHVLDKRYGRAAQMHSLAARSGECDEQRIWLVEPIENLRGVLFD